MTSRFHGYYIDFLSDGTRFKVDPITRDSFDIYFGPDDDPLQKFTWIPPNKENLSLRELEAVDIFDAWLNRGQSSESNLTN